MKTFLLVLLSLISMLFTECKKDADNPASPPQSNPHWTQINLPLNTYVEALVVAPSGAGDTNLYAGTVNYGVFRSSNNGTSWVTVNSGLPAIVNVVALEAIPNGFGGVNLFAGIWPTGLDTIGSVFLSTNNGSSWVSVSVGLPSSITVNSLAAATNGTNLFAGSTRGVFRSTNSGTNWTAANAGLDTIVSSLAAVPNGAIGTNLYAATGTGVFLSTNNGANWQSVSSGLPANTGVGALKAYASQTGTTTLLVGMGGDLNSTRIYRSTNSGASWALANSGLPTSVLTVVHSFAFVPAVTGETSVVTGTSLGVYRSTDNGTSWQAMNSGLTSSSASSVYVVAFALVPNGSGGINLFAGSNVGLWKYSL
ncbi:MAG: hypothetical protein WBD36_07465 [Bacteroidota bacterium]